MFTTKLNLWSVTGYGNYCGASFLIAAIDQAGANKIIEEIKKDEGPDWDWDIEKQKGQLIGVEPGIIHSWGYTE